MEFINTNTTNNEVSSLELSYIDRIFREKREILKNIYDKSNIADVATYYEYVCNNVIYAVYLMVKFLNFYNIKENITINYKTYVDLLNNFGEDFIKSLPGDWEICD